MAYSRDRYTPETPCNISLYGRYGGRFWVALRF